MLLLNTSTGARAARRRPSQRTAARSSELAMAEGDAALNEVPRVGVDLLMRGVSTDVPASLTQPTLRAGRPPSLPFALPSDLSKVASLLTAFDGRPAARPLGTPQDTGKALARGALHPLLIILVFLLWKLVFKGNKVVLYIGIAIIGVSERVTAVYALMKYGVAGIGYGRPSAGQIGLRFGQGQPSAVGTQQQPRRMYKPQDDWQ